MPSALKIVYFFLFSMNDALETKMTENSTLSGRKIFENELSQSLVRESRVKTVAKLFKWFAWNYSVRRYKII